MNLNALKDKAYKLACERGFHDTELSNKHCLCLVISELMEAVEADRKGKRADMGLFKEYQGNRIVFSEDTRIQRFKQDFEAYIKDSVGDELADAVIRLLNLAGLRNIDLGDWDEWWDEVVTSIELNVKNDYSFPELMFGVCKNIISELASIENVVCSTIGMLRVICYVHKIDIEWHIEQKMRYNSLREKMHGKKY